MILTTDHGLAFPDAKATMYDRGIGVLLIMRGPGGFERGRVFDALVSHLDVFPTHLRGGRHRSARSGWKERRCCRSCAARSRHLHQEVFAEVTYHAAYEPQRAVRTARYKYVRRFDDAIRAGSWPTSTTA